MKNSVKYILNDCVYVMSLLLQYKKSYLDGRIDKNKASCLRVTDS